MKATFFAIAVCLTVCLSLIEAKSKGKRVVGDTETRLKRQTDDSASVEVYSKPGDTKAKTTMAEDTETRRKRQTEDSDSIEVYSKPDDKNKPKTTMAEDDD